MEEHTHQAGGDPRAERKDLLRRVLLWATSSAVGAGLLSLLVHLLLALLAAAWVLQRAPGVRAAGPVEIELAVVTETQLKDLQDSAALAAESDLSLDQSEAESDLLPEPQVVGAVVEPALSLAGAGSLTAMGGAGEGLGEGMDLSSAAVGGGAASFFGVEARGSRFAYIVDISGSMAGPKMLALQDELRRSIGSLLEHSTFIVVVFSSDARVLGGSAKWRRATERNKASADREVRALSEGGGTNPLKAFETVFEMNPRPDAVYFMTDGLFRDSIAGAVSLMNRAGTEVTPVHCISFVSREAQALMQSMAQQSGGTYTHVEGPGR